MGVFGDIIIYDNGTIKYQHNATTTDTILNQTIGVTLIICFIISTTLNPVVYLHHYNKSSNLVTLLYQMLSACDFFTNLYYPLLSSYNLLRNHTDNTKVHPASLFNVVTTVITMPCCTISVMLTSIISITRLICIRYPFCRVVYLRKYVLGYIVIYICYFYSFYVYNVAGFKHPNWFRFRQVAWGNPITPDTSKILEIMWYSPLAFHCIVGLLTSLVTVNILYSKHHDSTDPHLERKSSFGILAMNVGNVSFLAISLLDRQFLQTDSYFSYPLQLCSFGVVPFFYSAFNPAIVILCSTAIKRKVSQWFDRIISSDISSSVFFFYLGRDSGAKNNVREKETRLDE